MMKNKYFWPYHTATVIFLGWVVISGILGTVVTHLVGEKGNYPPPLFFPLLIFSPVGIIMIALLLTYVKVTDEEIICFKSGFIRYKIKLSDVTEWGVYIKDAGRTVGDVLYITSIPISELRTGKIINKKALRHKNKRKFIMLGYDDTRLIDFLKENFSVNLNNEFLYEKSDYIGRVDESNRPLF
jgi:hypothetical protein